MKIEEGMTDTSYIMRNDDEIGEEYVICLVVMGTTPSFSSPYLFDLAIPLNFFNAMNLFHC